MGAHSAAGHGSRRTVTAAAGLTAALVTTAATGLLTGGTALATDGSGHGGSGHSHGHGSRSSGGWATGWDSGAEQASDRGRTAQAWCDVLGDVDLGDGSACASDDGSSDASGHDNDSSDDSSHDATTVSQAAATPAPAAPAPKPRPTSSVPDHPTVQPIVAPASGRKVVPIASTS
jgi:hypothetical protein